MPNKFSQGDRSPLVGQRVRITLDRDATVELNPTGNCLKDLFLQYLGWRKPRYRRGDRFVGIVCLDNPTNWCIWVPSLENHVYISKGDATIEPARPEDDE